MKMIEVIEKVFSWFQKPEDCSMEWFIAIITVFYWTNENIWARTVSEDGKLVDLLTQTGVYESKSEFYRAVKGNAVRINNLPVAKESKLLDYPLINVEGSEYKLAVVRTGKTTHELLLFDTNPW
jgi:tyrosyl-tRNA synthetase